MLELYTNIRKRRQELGMSQEELAKKVGYTSRSTVARVESGEIDLPRSKIFAFAEALKTTPAELMGLDGTLEEELAKEYHIERMEIYKYCLELKDDAELLAVVKRASTDSDFRNRLLGIVKLMESDK